MEDKKKGFIKGLEHSLGIINRHLAKEKAEGFSDEETKACITCISAIAREIAKAAKKKAAVKPKKVSK